VIVVGVVVIVVVVVVVGVVGVIVVVVVVGGVVVGAREWAVEVRGRERVTDSQRYRYGTSSGRERAVAARRERR